MILNRLVAGGGIEPPSLDKETRKKTTSLSCHNPDCTGLAICFIVLCVPLDCFIPCQSHGVVRAFVLDNYAYLYLVKTSLYSVCALLNRFKLRDHVPTGRTKITYRLCHTTPSGFVHNAQSASFFHLHYGTSGFLGRNGNSGTRTLDFPVMSRTF